MSDTSPSEVPAETVDGEETLPSRRERVEAEVERQKAEREGTSTP